MITKYIKPESNVIIETGTWLGQTTEKFAAIEHIEAVHTVELGEHLYNTAVEKFRENTKVHLWFGDSGEKLSEMLQQIINTVKNPKITVYLDAHFSGGGGPFATVRGSVASPVQKELETLIKFRAIIDTVMIDDCKAFYDPNYDGRDPQFVEGWGSLNETMDLLEKINPQFTVIVDRESRPNHLLLATTGINTDSMNRIDYKTESNKLMDLEILQPFVLR